jgi:uncharacterized membrane protein
MDLPIPMPASCPDCAAQMPETAAFCPGCGRPMPGAMTTVAPSAVTATVIPEAATESITAAASPTRAQGTVGFLAESIAGAIAYLTFIPAIVFLIVEPYKNNRFVRFHSIQCLLFCAAAGLTALALKVGGLLLYFIPVVGPLFVVLVSVVVGLAAVAVWLVLVVKALQGEMFKLPVLGDFAEKNAGSL